MLRAGDGCRAERRDVAPAAVGRPAAVPGAASSSAWSITIRRSTSSCRRGRRSGAAADRRRDRAGPSFSPRTLGETRQPAAWALAEATARTSELPAIRSATWISTPGTGLDCGEHEDRAALGPPDRVGCRALDATHSHVLGRHAGRAAGLRGRPAAAESRQASACVAIAETLRRAGLGREPDVRPVSVAAWAGRQVFEQTGRIEAVAAALGMRSLDRAARAHRLGLDRRAIGRPDESTTGGVSALERVEAIAREPGDLRARRTRPRRRSAPWVAVAAHYPAFMWLALRSAASASTAAPARSKPNSPTPPSGTCIRDRSAASSPRTRAELHCRRGRCAATTTSTPATATSPTPTSSPRSPALHRELAADQARELGLLDPDGPGLVDPSRPDRGCSTPTAKSSPPCSGPSPATPHSTAPPASSVPAALEPDAGLHFEGDGDAAWGTKFVLVAARTDRRPRPHHPRRRMGPHPRRRSPHRDRLLHPPRTPHPRRAGRHLRHRPARRAPPDPAPRPRPPPHQPRHRRQGQPPRTRRRNERRVEKSAHVEDKTITLADGTRHTLTLYARGGALGIGELTDTGDLAFTELPRVRTHRNRDKNGKYRWYNDYQLPDQLRRPAPSPSGSTATTTTPRGSSTAPRTSGPSRPATPTSHGSTPAATTPSPSTATSTTPSGSAAPTASATPANTSTSSASRSMVNSLALHRHRRRRAEPLAA